MMGEGTGDGEAVPRVEIFVHPDHRLPDGFALEKLQRVCEAAVEGVMGYLRDGAVLSELDEVEVTLVGDAVIAEVHVEFMSIEGATDVITFDHGEILISTDTAAVQGAENGNSIERESALYMVHGLLHLAGYADKTPEDFALMARLQEEVLGSIWEE